MKDVAMAVTADGKGITSMALAPKTFASGKNGFWGQARVDTSTGERYMVQAQLVRIEPATPKVKKQ